MAKKGEVKKQMTPVQQEELREELRDMVFFQGMQHLSIMKWAKTQKKYPIGPAMVQVYYYQILDEIKDKWNNESHLQRMREYVKDQYFSLYQKSVAMGDLKNAKLILDSTTKLKGIGIIETERKEVTITDSTIKFKFDDENDDDIDETSTED